MTRNAGWFRFYERMIDSPQILELSDAEFRLIVSMWCIASGQEQRGYLPFSARTLQRRALPDHSVDEVVAMLAHLVELALLETTEQGYSVAKWNEHQYTYPSLAPEARREQKRKEREQQQERASQERRKSVARSRNVDTDTERDTDTDTEENIASQWGAIATTSSATTSSSPPVVPTASAVLPQGALVARITDPVSLSDPLPAMAVNGPLPAVRAATPTYLQVMPALGSPLADPLADVAPPEQPSPPTASPSSSGTGRAWEFAPRTDGETDRTYYARVIPALPAKHQLPALVWLAHEKLGTESTPGGPTYGRIGKMAKQYGAGRAAGMICEVGGKHVDGNPLDYLARMAMKESTSPQAARASPRDGAPTEQPFYTRDVAALKRDANGW